MISAVSQSLLLWAQLDIPWTWFQAAGRFRGGLVWAQTELDVRIRTCSASVKL